MVRVSAFHEEEEGIVELNAVTLVDTVFAIADLPGYSSRMCR
jgi:hypothetical protein